MKPQNIKNFIIYKFYIFMPIITFLYLGGKIYTSMVELNGFDISNRIISEKRILCHFRKDRLCAVSRK